MIVVLGRPILAPPEPGDAGGPRGRPTGLPAEIALAAHSSGAEVELVGTIGDDPEGDLLAVELGRHGIGHAALLRDPAGRTLIAGSDRGRAPRVDASDIELGLRYLSEVRVIVVAESIPEEAEKAVIESAGFNGAHLIAIAREGERAEGLRGEPAATVLSVPDPPPAAFAEAVGRYAARLDGGQEPETAFATAWRDTGWEPAGEA